MRRARVVRGRAEEATALVTARAAAAPIADIVFQFMRQLIKTEGKFVLGTRCGLTAAGVELEERRFEQGKYRNTDYRAIIENARELKQWK